MAVQLHAQPYGLDATGFYFETMAEYDEKYAKNLNHFGGIVEEYELQFIDGETIDAELFTALGINQATVARYLEVVDEWQDYEKVRVIIAVGENMASFDLNTGKPDDIDVDVYEVSDLTELAEQFVEDGLFGDIPEQLQNYIDYEAIGRDLGMDYGQTTVDGTNYAYRSC